VHQAAAAPGQGIKPHFHLFGVDAELLARVEEGTGERYVAEVDGQLLRLQWALGFLSYFCHSAFIPAGINGEFKRFGA
jgi:hypothetical protein